jgi:hypothetical protein
MTEHETQMTKMGELEEGQMVQEIIQAIFTTIMVHRNKTGAGAAFYVAILDSIKAGIEMGEAIKTLLPKVVAETPTYIA